MQKSNAAARVADCLLEPDHGFLLAGLFVGTFICVFGFARGVPSRRHGDDDEEGEDRARDEGQEVGVCERVDVVEGEAGVEAEGVGEVRHYLGGVF